MISYREALQLIADHTKPLKKVSLPLEQALGAVSFETVKSSICTPPFDNSAMDGFAIRAVDTLNVNPDSPLSLRVVGSIAAGDTPPFTQHQPQTAWEIMTGAPIPTGYDAVIRIEDVDITKTQPEFPAEIRIQQLIKPGENLRKAGEDFKHEDIVIEAARAIAPRHVMGLASVGIHEIATYQRPTIGIICTGSEIAKDNPKQGQIYNANAPYLSSMCHRMALHAEDHGMFPDNDPSKFVDYLTQLFEGPNPPTIILSTGAVSAGKWDFIPAALEQLHANIIFHKILIRPGKPILFAQLANEHYFFGLPGNPISAAVGLRFLVYPLLRLIQGLPEETPIMATLESDVRKKKGFRCFFKASSSMGKKGQLNVTVSEEQESFKIRPLIKANCWAVLEEERSGYQAGEIITTYPLCPNFS